MKLKETSKNLIYSKQKEVSKELKNCLTNTKKQKGITLIALVVTIIVLLILAGVTINIALGDNGIFKKAKETQKIQALAEEKEKLENARLAAMIDGLGTVTVDSYINELVKEGITTLDKVTDNGDGSKTIITDNGFEVKISPTENGKDVKIEIDGDNYTGGSSSGGNNTGGGETTTPENKVTEISLSQTSADLKIGETLQLTATVTPSTASNQNVNWNSSNTSVVTVSTSSTTSGTKITLTAVGEGTATITATAADGSEVKAECSITVKPILITTSETMPYFPNSNFTHVSGTTLDTGLVVKDKSGNQYVWVEVPKTTEVYSTAGLNITNFTSEEYVQIENDLHTYTNYYRNGTSYTDTYYSDDVTGLTETQYTQLKQKMLKSVYENGGFWVARYEAGIETNRTAKGDATVAPISKANVYPYNYITCSQAQTLANMLTTSDYTSSLMFGVQWDLVLKFIEVKSVAKGTELATIQSELRSNSKSWGNYYDNLWKISSTSAKYSTDDGSTYTSTPYTKTSSADVLLTTGASESFSKMNISDLAGNEFEWTLEYTARTSYPCAFRGGVYERRWL